MQIAKGAPLSAKTTLGLGGPAKRLARVTGVRELETALALEERTLVLGGGSNLVVSDAGWDGLVLEMAIRGVNVRRHDGFAVVSAFAGEPWDEFVARMIDERLVGVECLSGIPGLVGATPMQNVGAYGQEVSDTIVFVRVYDREARQVIKFEPRECAFAYRSSVFRGTDRYVVLEVRFRLRAAEESAPIAYAELARALGIAEGKTAPLARVRETVLALRRGKGMVVDPADPESRSAGSFFTNPILAPDALAALEARVAKELGAEAALPKFPAPAGAKVSAAWLIERSGFTKGCTRGNVGISRKHALALVNRGGATTRELLDLADAITLAVRTRWGVELAREPVLVGP
jgi:UDP-N-acetylmuramate dehydrogenase